MRGMGMKWHVGPSPLTQLPQFEVKNGRKSLISNVQSGEVGTTFAYALGDFEAFGKD